MYSRKEIERIIKKGTIKERLYMMGEDDAHKSLNKGRFLTEEDYANLSETFKTQKSIDLVRKQALTDSVVVTGITNVQGLLYEVKMHMSNLRGYIILWTAIEGAEQLANSILHQVNNDQREEISKKALKNLDILLTDGIIDKEGYIELKVDFTHDSAGNEKYSLLFAMRNVRAEVESSIKKYFTWDKAVRDYMVKNSFEIQSYYEKLDDMKRQAITYPFGWEKYKGIIDLGLENEKHDILDEVIKQYSITPDLTVTIDKEEYKWFNKNVLGI